MRASVTNSVRDALLSVALFGSIGVALAQSPPQNTGNVESTQSPKVPGHDALEEQSVKQAQPGAESAVFVDGRLNVPNAPADTSTTPSKVSQRNAQLDLIPTMAHGPQLTDDQRKLIVERVMATGGPPPAHVEASPTSELPANVDMQAWPADIVSQAPSIRGTKYVKLSDKILVVRPDNRIVVEEIGK